MQAELVTWRPLFEFGMIAIVLGVVGLASRRSLSTWLVSQGLLLLGMVLGFTAFSAVHHRAEGRTLALWVIAAWAMQLVVGVRWLIGCRFVPVRDGEPADREHPSP